MNIIEQFDTLPPYIVRRMYRGTSAQLACACGLSIPTVKRIARLRSWGSMRVRDAQVFATACGYDLTNPYTSAQGLAAKCEIGLVFPHLSKNAQRHLAKLFKS